MYTPLNRVKAQSRPTTRLPRPATAAAADASIRPVAPCDHSPDEYHRDVGRAESRREATATWIGRVLPLVLPTGSLVLCLTWLLLKGLDEFYRTLDGNDHDYAAVGGNCSVRSGLPI